MKGTLSQILAQLQRTRSMSEGRRLTVQGAVKINGVVLDDLTKEIEVKTGDIISIGSNPLNEFVVPATVV